MAKSTPGHRMPPQPRTDDRDGAGHGGALPGVGAAAAGPEDGGHQVVRPARQPRGRRTATSTDGVSGRESHDSSAFYRRFKAPVVDNDDHVEPCTAAGQLFCGDSRQMTEVPTGSVALVITSPPYFVGKAYENDLASGRSPATYSEHLSLLRAVFAECKRALEPGGRIAVNVANIGRKPYRSLSSDVWSVLTDDLGFLAAGEVVWVKAQGATSNCAWGSWCRPSAPSLRDVTERILIASKGRFDRALAPKERQARGLPWQSDITSEEFMAATLDTWYIRPESAKRIGHPAPFPVGLAERLIALYTYRDDVVLDPFMGSGTTAVAAVRRGRRWIGYELDPGYVATAASRIAKAAEPETPEQPRDPRVP